MSVLPIGATVPGLIVVIFVEIYGFLHHGDLPGAMSTVYTLLLLTLPWITILTLRHKTSSLGISRRSMLKNMGWGILAGVLWRLSSLLFNLALLELSGIETTIWAQLQSLVLIPWMEEVFFRGYIGFAFSQRCGRGLGNLLQASLFTLQPAHVVQGFPGLISIFVFGLIAGWLVRRNESLWISVAAHAAANAVLLPLAQFV